LNANHPATKTIFPFVLQDGRPSELHQRAALRSFKPGDVFIKGANALDVNGDIGILIAAETGGSAYDAWYATSIRSGHFICPVGLEKLVPSVREAARLCGQDTYYYCQGIRVGMIPIMNATVVTEIEAFRILFDLRAVHVGGGGIGDSQGAVVLVAEGEKEPLDRAIALIASIKGEPSLAPRKSACANCLPTILVQSDAGVRREVKYCMFQGLGEEELPAFIRQAG